MTRKKTTHSLALCIVLHQPNLAAAEQDASVVQAAWNNTLFPAITDTYIPLLRMFDSLAKKDISFKINMVISPTLCSMLDDYIIQEHYTLWLENLIELGEKELIKTKNNEEENALAKLYLKNLKQTYSYFAGITQGTLLLKFSEHASAGRIELLGTTLEHCYLPHYAQYPELINAHIEAGLSAHKAFFGSAPDGFWLPFMGYAPTIEDSIRKYGFNYTILNTHGFLFANPEPPKGIFSPARCMNLLTVFAHDKIGKEKIFGPTGYSRNPIYRDQNRDLGFEANIDDLQMFFKKDQARYATGFKYWSQKTPHTLYNEEKALQQASIDAQDFVDQALTRLNSASEELQGEKTSLVCVLDDQDLGQTWHEGIIWLTEVIKNIEEKANITSVMLSDLIDPKEELPKTQFFMSSSEGSGYAENLLDKTNSWIYHSNLKSVERMIELSHRFPNDTGLKERALNLAAREILFATSSDWAKMAQNASKGDELDLHIQSILDFSTIFDSLGASNISTKWLTQAEKRYPFFAWTNYRIFCKK